ncbi:NAD(P)-dependent alcohol dehydrogenase [Agromyces marinus]|uniref:NADPH:quinone reductase n=2 Tax=Agromyces marinus TaxID=1389020 RepID=A0ABN6YF31_9MICO|nr:NAD(P)-dependent alcohol dehydrogenase [Agromyces marinus]UIP59187.1 Narbonolide/10-deoxymethynolide synthase PikA2, modules 3 and 4 [Agromyces marinus]BDZ55813.1 NADPH:quinone reductase [Agromyces marinus]
MRALIQNGYGGPEVLAAADLPEPGPPGPGLVAVAVHAAGLHAGDVWIMRGEPLMIRAAFGRTRPKQPVVGRDITGVVTAVGEGVTTLAVGDRVFAESDQGGFAETALVDARFVRPAPANLDDAHAAVIPVSGTTALQAVRLAAVGPGDRVLVIGASGGVGTYVVQLAVALGATVTGVASAAKADHVRAAGAGRVIDRRTEELGADGARYDVIVDLVAAQPLGALIGLLAPRGTLVLSAGTGSRTFGPLPRLAAAVLRSPFTRRRLKPLVARRSGDDLDELRAHAEAGRLRPRVDAVFPLDRAPEAFARLAAGRVTGKVAIRVRGDGEADAAARADADAGAEPA